MCKILNLKKINYQLRKVMMIFSFILLIPSISFSSEKLLLCKINEELENNIPTQKKKFISKKIEIYLDQDENWLYEIKKNDWELLNPEKLNLISQSFTENTRHFIYIKKVYNTENKKYLQSIDKVVLVKETMEIKFLKEYYNNHIKFFSSEVRGICK